MAIQKGPSGALGTSISANELATGGPTWDSSGNLTATGNLTLSGSGKRITGDFSNATIANRVIVQTSTVNGNTLFRAIPNGTATQANIAVANSSDAANCAVMQIVSASTEAQLSSAINGTGTYNPMTFYTGGSERMRIDTSGNVGIGTSTNNVYDNVAAGRPLVVQSSSSATTAGSSTNSITISNSDTTTNNLSQLNFAAITGANASQFSAAWIACQYGARTNGQYPTGQLIFATSTSLNSAPSEKMRIDSSGNLLFNSGYGSVATAYGCRAWVNFDGTGAVAIRASGNVSSITDNNVGSYTVNFTTTLADANYSVSGIPRNTQTYAAIQVLAIGISQATAPTTSALAIVVTGQNDGAVRSAVDSDYVCLAIFR